MNDLTAVERKALALTGDLAGLLQTIVGDGPNCDDDLRELFVHLHGIQNAIMAQVCARRNPRDFRLMGETLTPENKIRGGFG